MHLANQRLRKPDKLSQGAHSQTSYPKVQWKNTLDKKELQNPSRGEKKKDGESKKQGGMRIKKGHGECRVIGQEPYLDIPMLQEAS